MNQQYFKTAKEWREWLRQNHDREQEVWVVFYKKAAGEPTVSYESAVEEALCFGWIDSIMRRIDNRRHMQKFTPRKPSSRWSSLNRERVAKLIAENRMTPAGIAAIEVAKRNGRWDVPDLRIKDIEPSAEFLAALKDNKTASEFFNSLPPSARSQFIAWTALAKRAETRENRVREAMELLEKGKRLGMK